MAKLSKRLKAMREKVEPGRMYDVEEAFAILKDIGGAKFAESVDVSVNLGVDPRKSDQVVRGATVLPNGTGKTMRVAVFATGDKADEAREAGADLVGMEDLADKVKAGEMNFDVVVASPDAMRVVGQLGRVLGPRGLMPNPKTGTVTPDVGEAVRRAKGGQVTYRTDKAGIIHCSIGKLSFEPTQLKENLDALIGALNRGKPSAAKGIYLKKVTVSSTMGPGIQVDRGTLAAG
ncbi:MAG: large subunit ribosomal protein L1 [Gammaproteobacteria bacterium]|jgi:large subunit ribosomal protein L1